MRLRSAGSLGGVLLFPGALAVVLLASFCDAGKQHHHGHVNHPGKAATQQRSSTDDYQSPQEHHWHEQSVRRAADLAHANAWTHNSANAVEGYHEHPLFGEHHGATQPLVQEPADEAAETKDEGPNRGWRESDEGNTAAEGLVDYSDAPMDDAAPHDDTAVEAEGEPEQQEAANDTAAEPVDSNAELQGAAEDDMFIPEHEREAFELGGTNTGFSWTQAEQNHWRDGQDALEAFPASPQEEEEDEWTEMEAEEEDLEALELKALPQETATDEETATAGATEPVNSNDELQGTGKDAIVIPENERKAFELGTKGFSGSLAEQNHYRYGQAALEAFPSPPQEEEEEEEEEGEEGTEMEAEEEGLEAKELKALPQEPEETDTANAELLGAADDDVLIPEKERKAFELGTKGFSWTHAEQNHWRDGQAALKAFPSPPQEEEEGEQDEEGEEEEGEEGTEMEAEEEALGAPELNALPSFPQEPEDETSSAATTATEPVDSNVELQGAADDDFLIPEKERKAFELGTKGFSWSLAEKRHYRDGKAALKAFPPPPQEEQEGEEEEEGIEVEGLEGEEEEGPGASDVTEKQNEYSYPQVYIYGLEQSCFSSGGSSIERTLPLRLRETGHYQPDISKADLFLVPAQPSCHRPAASATASDYIRRVLETEVRPLGAWDRPGGPRRHLWVFSSDHGFCGFDGRGLVGIPEIKDSVILSPWGLKGIEHDVNLRNETDQRPRPTGPGALPCHVPGKDIVIPPDLGIAEVPGGCSAPVPRDVQLLFNGNSGLNSALGYSHGVRQMVFLMFGDRQKFPMYRITESGGSYEDMQHAKFCLAPTGSGWGEHLYHIMQRGCIPVIVQDDVAQPWEDEPLDYTKFAVVVQQYKLHRLPMILNAIAERPGLLEAMQREACRVAPLFAWEWNGSGTAMAATMDLLAARLRRAEAEQEAGQDEGRVGGSVYRRLLGLRRAQ